MRQHILKLIDQEREYQDHKWGHEFDNTHTPYEWAGFISKYAHRNLNANKQFNTTDWLRFRNDMLKVAAIAVAAVEAIDRAH